MPKPRASLDDLQARRRRRFEWRSFRQEHLFSQKKLAEVLKVSLRTVQGTEGAESTPIASTLRSFAELKNRYERERQRANRWAG